MDRLTPERRSWLMSQVGSKDTAPEMVVRRMVFAMGYRYRLHGPKLPGKPDLVFGSRRKVLFVHGCFWHGHEDCRLSRTPKSNSGFWRDKAVSNRARDLRNLKDLAELGWGALTVWQCELKDREHVAERIKAFLEE
ncbi:DNA mismatch endonuclease Vsr [Luteimonas yindakuii]|uniref:very short patch repair endonuclease n=1 Tax=Luteimonas yindakuii TaxID=2565782 RepID=UPI0010A58048|nr:very short patch repair endonuclease [Luteimonas yindakuii]QCO66977.1 DNA mismatch endonuclease Vsr [Luteimonas yindakuii]